MLSGLQGNVDRFPSKLVCIFLAGANFPSLKRDEIGVLGTKKGWLNHFLSLKKSPNQEKTAVRLIICGFSKLVLRAGSKIKNKQIAQKTSQCDFFYQFFDFSIKKNYKNCYLFFIYVYLPTRGIIRIMSFSFG